MGFAMTEPRRQLRSQADRPLQERRDPPAKNRVVGSRHLAANRVEKNSPQPLETTSETSVTITITVSGLSCWVSRDPIEEWGGLNAYGLVANNPIVRWDLLGLATTWTFHSYIKDYDWFSADDIVVHHKFSIDVWCTQDGVAVNGGTVGPTVEVNETDQSAVNGPIVLQINQKDLQVDWTGMAIEGDMPGWTVGAATGTGLGFIFFGPSPEDLIFAGIGGLIGGIVELWDDEIVWSYRRSVVFSCTCVDNDDDTYTYTVDMKEDPRPVKEEYKDNDWFDFYTEYTHE